MSVPGDGMRRPEGPKGAGLEAILALARRSPRHSSLFWFLFDQHDQLIEAKRQSGLGIPLGIHVAAVRRSKPDALPGKSDNAQGRPTDVLARAEEEGAARRAGSQSGGRARVPACARSSAEYALALQRNVHGALVGSPTGSGRCAPVAVTAAKAGGGGRERIDRHAWRTGADWGAGGTAPGRGVHHHLRRRAPRSASVHLARGSSALGPAGVQRGAANPGDEEASEDALQLVGARAGRRSEQSCRQGMEKETWKIMRTAGASPH